MSNFKRHHPQIPDGILTSEIMWQLGRIDSYSISQDKSTLVYDVKYYDTEKNQGCSQFYTIKNDGSNDVMITDNSIPKSSPRFLNDGQIMYIQFDDETKHNQLYVMNADGSNSRRISSIKSGVDDFLVSPDNTKLIYVTQVKNIPSVTDLYPQMTKSSALIATDLMYLHWDRWMDTIPHPFVAKFDGNELTDDFDILHDTKFECPMCPFNSVSDLCWSPDSKTIVYVMKPSVGKEYSFRTYMSLYLYNTETKTSIDLMENDKEHGYLTTPVFSPNGKKIAFGLMKRDGYESDVKELYVYDLEKHSASQVETTFKDSISTLGWLEDSETIVFAGMWHAHLSVYRISLNNSEAVKLTENDFDYDDLTVVGNRIYTKRSSNTYAHEIACIDVGASNKITQITFENKHIFDQLKEVRFEERWVDSVDGKKIHTWVVFPPNFDPNKKYPTLLYCTGGPQQPILNGWHYRWNFMLMASNGYVVVCPNRRGCPSFGIEWTEEVSLHFGQHSMDDLLSCIDSVAKEKYVDADKLGCLGASYGGYTVFYLESHHNKRFKVFVAHDGVFSMVQAYLETDEMFFAQRDMGAPWDAKTDPVIKQSYSYSPVDYVDQWDTPILVIHGAKDYRLTASQGLQAFNAARIRGIPAKLLLFPDENHLCLKPQNSLVWDRVVYDWLAEYLKQ